jgi:hypothetical protein
LHNKPQGCGASIASAAGPSPLKKVGKIKNRLIIYQWMYDEYCLCEVPVGTAVLCGIVAVHALLRSVVSRDGRFYWWACICNAEWGDSY